MKTLKLEVTELDKSVEKTVSVQITPEEIQVVNKYRAEKKDKDLPEEADKPGKLTYTGMIRHCLNFRPVGKEGQKDTFKIQEIVDRGRIEKALRKISNDDEGNEKEQDAYPLVLTLEDKDAQNLVKFVRQVEWPNFSLELADFLSAIDRLETQKPE